MRPLQHTMQTTRNMYFSPNLQDYKLNLRFGPWSEPLKVFLKTMKDDDYLLLLVYNDDNGIPDNTSITVTGGIEPNESVEDALEREIHEEAGIDQNNNIKTELGTKYTYVNKFNNIKNTVYLHKQKFPNSGNLNPLISKDDTYTNNTLPNKKVGTIWYSDNIQDFDWFLRSWGNNVPHTQKEKNGHRGYIAVSAYKVKRYLKVY